MRRKGRGAGLGVQTEVAYPRGSEYEPSGTFERWDPEARIEGGYGVEEVEDRI